MRLRNMRVPDDDTLVRAAREALTHPPDSWFSDERLFRTHGLVFAMTRDSDTLDTSNYVRVKEDLTDTFGEQVEEVHANHWAVGWVDQLEIPVVRDADDDITPGNITAVFAAATAIAVHLRDDYPVYDESDLSEREYQEVQRTREVNWDDVRHRLWLEYDVDFGDITESDRASFDEFFRDAEDDYGNEAWVEVKRAAEKIMNRRWAGFTADDAKGW